jgi:hypothetical protein
LKSTVIGRIAARYKSTLPDFGKAKGLGKTAESGRELQSYAKLYHPLHLTPAEVFR